MCSQDYSKIISKHVDFNGKVDVYVYKYVQGICVRILIFKYELGKKCLTKCV